MVKVKLVNPIDKFVETKLKTTYGKQFFSRYDSEEAKRLGKIIKSKGYNFTQVAEFLAYQRQELNLPQRKSLRTKISQFVNGHFNDMSVDLINFIGDNIHVFIKEVQEAEVIMDLQLKELDTHEERTL